MKFRATGAGQAVVQLDVNYGVDYEPHKDIPPKVSFSFIQERETTAEVYILSDIFQYFQILFHE